MFSVRGKRTRRDHKTVDTQRKRGRPLKRPKEVQESKVAVNERLREHQRTASSIPGAGREIPSALELLPNELIQHIFFYCFEINLPRSSPLLAAALSKASTYKALILFAFFCDETDLPVETHLFRPAEYRYLEPNEKTRLQNGILSCRWCTFSRLRSCLPDLCRLKMMQEWHRERWAELTLREQYGAEWTYHVDASESEISRLPDPDDTGQLERHFLAHARSLADLQALQPDKSVQYLLSIARWRYQRESDEGAIVRKLLGPSRSGIMTTHVIPDALLSKGSWTQDRLNFIQLLRQSLHWDDRDRTKQISTEAILQGIVSAIMNENLEAMRTLLELRSAVLFAGLSRTESDVNLPLAFFHLAARQKAQSPQLLSLLVRASMESIPREDTVLTAWALRHQTQYPMARWLLEIMSGTNDIRYHADGSRRNSQVPDPSPTSTIPEVSFANELGYVEHSGGTFAEVTGDGHLGQ